MQSLIHSLERRMAAMNTEQLREFQLQARRESRFFSVGGVALIFSTLIAGNLWLGLICIPAVYLAARLAVITDWVQSRCQQLITDK